MAEEKPCRNVREDDRLYWTFSPLEDAEGGGGAIVLMRRR
jgi:hypothetical protein